MELNRKKNSMTTTPFNDQYRFLTKWQSIYGRITNQCLFVKAFFNMPCRSLCFVLMFVGVTITKQKKLKNERKKNNKNERKKKENEENAIITVQLSIHSNTEIQMYSVFNKFHLK